MSEIIKNRFKMLSSIDCSEYVEKKNGLSYLSWAWAWAKFKEIFPDSFYTIYEDDSHRIYHTDGNTCWVKTGVTLVDGDYKNESIEYLPVMDFKNRSIPAAAITSMDANKAIQRSLTKAVARHGLGLYIYAGEDLPDVDDDTKAEQEAALAAKKYKAEKLEVLKVNITNECKRIVAGKSKPEITEFNNSVVKPALNGMRVGDCKDEKLLAELLIKLTDMK